MATRLQSVSASGGEPRSLTTLARDKGEVGHYYPFAMPDGKAILFTITTGPTIADSAQIAALDLQTGRYKTVIDGGRKHRPRRDRSHTPFMARLEERWRRRRNENGGF